MSKITPEDMDGVRAVLKRSFQTSYEHEYDEQRDIALALILVRIWDRGYEAGRNNAIYGGRAAQGFDECPYTFAHTRHWCGYAGCREG